MQNESKTPIVVETTVGADVDKTWQYYSEPEHIKQWNSASDDWHTPEATNDLRIGGKFTSRMESKDGSMGFNFEGEYTQVVPKKLIEYVMSDGRKVKIEFLPQAESTRVVTTFDAEKENPEDMQKAGWQAILDNFRKHTEA